MPHLSNDGDELLAQRLLQEPRLQQAMAAPVVQRILALIKLGHNDRAMRYVPLNDRAMRYVQLNDEP